MVDLVGKVNTVGGGGKEAVTGGSGASRTISGNVPLFKPAHCLHPCLYSSHPPQRGQWHADTGCHSKHQDSSLRKKPGSPMSECTSASIFLRHKCSWQKKAVPCWRRYRVLSYSSDKMLCGLKFNQDAYCKHFMASHCCQVEVQLLTPGKPCHT